MVDQISSLAPAVSDPEAKQQELCTVLARPDLPKELWLPA